MTGTIILTGANGSVGLYAAEHLLKTYPQYTAIFTVRSAAHRDVNTKSLREVVSQHPEVQASIHEVDLSRLSDVHEFASSVSTAITAGQYPPLKSIICNAYYWNLVTDPELTVDGYEKGFQINHIAHVALVLRLVSQFAPDGGRIELLSSITHYCRPTQSSPYAAEMPDDLNQLIHPPCYKDKQARGFQRYGISKLTITTWLYPLNRYLQEANNSKLSNITAVAINPGNLGDSRAFGTNTPNSMKLMQRLVLRPFLPVLQRFVDPAFRSVAEAAVDVIDLGVGKAHPKERGYFTLLKKDESDPVTLNEDTQQKIWIKSAEWAGITKDNTALKVAFN
ncbi:putative short-chain dehydrogenase [Hypoxylon fuscum]|nr:putative short-chain dehydrogenase [Hypoxylon fuscum]